MSDLRAQQSDGKFIIQWNYFAEMSGILSGKICEIKTKLNPGDLQ